MMLNIKNIKMVKKIIIFSILAIPFLIGCTKDADALEIQKLYTYDNQYFENLRTYKKSDHTIFFGWMASYAPIEGAGGYKDPASWGERIIGIPDSLDIVSLWGGIPSNDPNSSDYAPVAYKDMQYVREIKGTKFLDVTIVRFNKEITLKDGTKFDLRLPANRTDEGIKIYGKYLVDKVIDNNLDGLDLDYEPEGDWIGSPDSNFLKLIEYVGQYLGPLGSKNKILTIDFYNQIPPDETGKYVDFFIRQSYAASSAGTLQAHYNSVQNAIPPSKFIVTENFGDYAADGGIPFREANGNTLTSSGSRMYSLEGMARWNPTQGKKGGFGAFYFGRDYYSKTGIPYYNLRRTIQIANPPIK